MATFMKEIPFQEMQTLGVPVIPVNCEGIAGAGLARAWRDDYRYYEDYQQYRLICQNLSIRPGQVRPIIRENNEFKTLLAFTKDDWRNKSELRWIELCIIQISAIAHVRPEMFCVPKLGCGYGGLNWKDDVRIMMQYHFQHNGNIIIMGEYE